MDRREFIKTAGATAVLAASGNVWTQNSPRPLPLLPMTDLTGGIDGRVPLALRPALHDFGNGAASDTFGINNNYLGPVLRTKQGQTLPFDVSNGIGDVTTLHWHGLHIPGNVDGGPHQEIATGDTWSPDVPIAQHASMNWFHSHTHGKTSQQTYKGLAGVLLIEDDASLSADLPGTYGVDDFTLVLQDKTFDQNGKMNYVLSAEVFEEGFIGDTLVVNGAIAPVAQTVPSGLVRLRILNACNARFLTLSMQNGPVTVIASDGGFLSSPVETETVVMSPGERYEILADMSSTDTNSLVVDFGAPEGVVGFLRGLLQPDIGKQTALTLTRNAGQQGFDGSMPKTLANMDTPDRSLATRTRSFSLTMDGGGEQFAVLAATLGNVCGNVNMGGLSGMGINGQPMNMDRIDEEVKTGDTELWRINVDDELHPFHIHGCSFRILSQEGATPPAYAQGWKDMVHVQEGWSEVLMTFNYEATKDAPYMYHCHILEHEDCGMMGQFTVT
ncbi:MAG: multicopper oxidase domain-containing protein [Pseudomonadota bacterium]